MKIQELLNDKGIDLTKGKALDSDGFKFRGSDVHVIYIADNQKLIDRFKTDVINVGVDLEFAVAIKENYEGSSVNPQAIDEVGTMPSMYVKVDYESMNRENCLASIRMLHDYIDKLQEGKSNLELTYFTHLPPNIKQAFLEKLLSRSNKIKILNSYSIWLTKNGYMDTDWKDEEPFAIDSFLKDQK